MSKSLGNIPVILLYVFILSFAVKGFINKSIILKINWYGLLFAVIACICMVSIDFKWGWASKGEYETY